MNRRAFISAIGSGSLLSFGGCISEFTGESSVELLQVGVLNWTAEAVSAQIEVRLGEEVVADVAYDLDAEGGGRVLDCTWPADPGAFAVAARLQDQDDWEIRDLTDIESECAATWIMIERPTGPPSMLISRDCEFYAGRC